MTFSVISSRNTHDVSSCCALINVTLIYVWGTVVRSNSQLLKLAAGPWITAIGLHVLF